MRVAVKLHYPWAGIPEDVEIIEFDDPSDLDDAVTETARDMVWSRIGVSYEVLDDINYTAS